MSNSEDDFMSDKFLVETAPSGPSTYTAKRSAQQLKSLRKGQANNQVSAKRLEEDKRREGLNTSLFETPHASGGGGGVAMGLMMKMGWKVGEGLGRKRSSSPPGSASTNKKARLGHDEQDEDKDEDEMEAPRPGIGGSGSRPRVEPIRVSLWQGRKGLSARIPSPPPLPIPSQNPDALHPKKLERLGKETEDFRLRQRREFEEKERERKEWKARELLVSFDVEKGVKFHPLHVMPSDPLGTLPAPLLKLIYPAQALSPSPGASPPPNDNLPGGPLKDNLSAAEKLRDQMRRDMLTELDGDKEEDLRFGIPIPGDESTKPISSDAPRKKEVEAEGEHVDWESHVAGTKRVLSMSNAEHLNFLVSQLRHEHLYCFWCAYKYTSYDELEGPGGCPGEDEDDH